MLEHLLIGLQQDLKCLLWAPLVSTLFRGLFIYMYGPSYQLKRDWKKLASAFNYGFWWGLDFHAYILLVFFLVISLPGTFIDAYFAMGDTIRTILLTLYLLVLYVAFWGKTIFYYHFSDTYNELIRLGKNADKNNFLDIFFNENHGARILMGTLPYLAITSIGIYYTLQTPIISVTLASTILEILAMVVTVLMTVALFYWLRYGGTFNHRNKPEWDCVPDIVKKDMFLAKATIDDLIALEMAYKKSFNNVLGHDDQTAIKNLKILPQLKDMKLEDNPLDLLARQAQGPRINKPKHIFFLVGESLTQSVVDPAYTDYHLADHCKDFQANPHTISLNNFLPSGKISQPAITSLISGIYDCDFEINEKPIIWQHALATSLPLQLKKLGYQTNLWYGGGLNWASLGLLASAMGFDNSFGGPDICHPDAPSTWLGIYDHIFLNRIQEKLVEETNDQPTMHFIYTTSNHAPATIPVEKYGWNPDTILGPIPEEIRNNKATVANLGIYWYAEKALFDFVDFIKETYEDSLIIITGDHASKIAGDILPNRSQTLREQYCTFFGIYHKDIDSQWVNPDGIGNHMQILPTLMELIAPKGFTYYSLMPSIFEQQNHSVTPYHWLTEKEIGYYGDQLAQDLTWRDGQNREYPSYIQNRQDFEDQRQAYLELTAWMLRHPEQMIEKDSIISSQD